MALPEYFLIGFTAGWLCGVLPHVGRRVKAALSARRDAPASGLWKPQRTRVARRAPPVLEALPRHMADVRLGLLRRGVLN